MATMEDQSLINPWEESINQSDFIDLQEHPETNIVGSIFLLCATVIRLENSTDCYKGFGCWHSGYPQYYWIIRFGCRVGFSGVGGSVECLFHLDDVVTISTPSHYGAG